MPMMGAAMHNRCEFDGGYHQRRYPPHFADIALAGDEDRCLTALMGVQLIGKDAARWFGGHHALGGQCGA